MRNDETRCRHAEHQQAMTHDVKRLIVTVEMRQPVERELLIEDLVAHVMPMIKEGYHTGEMHVSIGMDVGEGDGDVEVSGT